MVHQEGSITIHQLRGTPRGKHYNSLLISIRAIWTIQHWHLNIIGHMIYMAKRNILFTDATEYLIYRCNRIPYLPMQQNILFTDATEYLIYRCNRISYLPMQQNILFTDATEYLIYRCNRISYLPMQQNILFTDATEYLIYRCNRISYLPMQQDICQGVLFNLMVNYVFSRGIQSQVFLTVFYVLSGSGSGSPGGTTPSTRTCTERC